MLTYSHHCAVSIRVTLSLETLENGVQSGHEHYTDTKSHTTKKKKRKKRRSAKENGDKGRILQGRTLASRLPSSPLILSGAFLLSTFRGTDFARAAEYGHAPFSSESTKRETKKKDRR